MKKVLLGLLLTAAASLTARGEEVTLNFADLGLDNNASLTDYKVNDNITVSSTGTWMESWNAYRLLANQTLTVKVTDATLTGVNITCVSGRGFASWSTVTADSESSEFTADPFSWTGAASESWEVTAQVVNMNVRMESITFTYTPKAVSETLTASFLCKDLNLENLAPMPEGGYDINEYVNLDFAQGTHAAQPTYRTAVEGFYLFNGQQVVVSAKNGAKLLKIEIATTGNTFGYSGTVTADGESQTYETDYTWVPCEWEGIAEHSVVFTNEGRTGNTQVTGVTVTYQTPGEGLTVSRPVITPSETDNTVTITCETEGANIYYTLDETDPTAEEGMLYEAPFTLSEACTVKAIAVKEGVVSSVASLEVYLRIVDNLKSFLENESPDDVTITCPVTAIVRCAATSYLSVKDDKGNYALIYNTDSNLEEILDSANGTTWATMTAKFYPYSYYGYVQPIELGTTTQGEVVEPTKVTVSNFESSKPFEYVSLQAVKVEKGSYLNPYIFYDLENNELDGRNRFNITMPETEEGETTYYDVTGIVSNESDEFWPLEFTVNPITGISHISTADGEAVFYSLQGVRIESPKEEGIYVKIQDGKASKVIIRK